jgi:hypothetical protein
MYRKGALKSSAGRDAVKAAKEISEMKLGVTVSEGIDARTNDLLAGDHARRPGSKEVDARAGFKSVGSRTFYRDGDKWVDSRYDEQLETVKLPLFGKQYFELLTRHPEAGKYFALGSRVVVVLDGKAYETVDQQS